MLGLEGTVQSSAMRQGLNLESGIIKKYAETRGNLSVSCPGLVIHGELEYMYDWGRAHPCLFN
jgi:hypothetical protein